MTKAEVVRGLQLLAGIPSVSSLASRSGLSRSIVIDAQYGRLTERTASLLAPLVREALEQMSEAGRFSTPL